jgi:hypothetical protein
MLLVRRFRLPLNTMDVGIKAANDQFQSLTTVERTAIAVPVVGQCVWDSDLRQLMVYMNATTGNAWQPIGNSIVCASTTRPVTPFEGQQIYETDTNRSWTYNGAAFVPNDMVFTDEAARDAAITSPTEGMHAYLTAPTVPAATGTSTAVPTGVQTIYNGSVWVCLTPIGSRSNTDATTTSSSYVTTLTGDATPISVTLVTGTTALVQIESVSNISTLGTNFLTFSVSGATTLAADEENGTRNVSEVGGRNVGCSRSLIITGLTAGTNTFTLNYRTDGGTLTMLIRNILVNGIA